MISSPDVLKSSRAAIPSREPGLSLIRERDEIFAVLRYTF